MGLRQLVIFLFLQYRDRLESSESDVYRRQILTTKDYSRTIRANTRHHSHWEWNVIKQQDLQMFGLK